jgi:hypothetical protein
MPNFIFKKRKIVAPDYYGPFKVRMDWPTFEGSLIYLLPTLLDVGFQMTMEHQHLWNFEMSLHVQPDGNALLESTGFHTHGMKKGKQIDLPLIDNLKFMGLAQPSGLVRNWKITLTSEECELKQLSKIITHILELGYEFNPNLIQEVQIRPLKE